MNFFDRITGNDMKREMKQFDDRAQNLPQSYQNAWNEISKKLWKYSDLTGRNLMPILNGVMGMLEESALEDLPIEQVVGTDLDEFVRNLAEAEGAKDYRDKLRQQLNETVAKKLVGGR